MKRCSFISLLCATILCAQDIYTLDWSNIGSGANPDVSSAGEYTVQSTLGQFGAADAAGGDGEFSVSGGYWSFTLNEPLDLGLAMQIDGGTVTLSWNDSAEIPVRLESSPDLQLWQPVSPEPPHPPILDVSGVKRRFYRLMPVP